MGLTGIALGSFLYATVEVQARKDQDKAVLTKSGAYLVLKDLGLRFACSTILGFYFGLDHAAYFSFLRRLDCLQKCKELGAGSN